jgi:hypothetical protein
MEILGAGGDAVIEPSSGVLDGTQSLRLAKGTPAYPTSVGDTRNRIETETAEGAVTESGDEIAVMVVHILRDPDRNWSGALMKE